MAKAEGKESGGKRFLFLQGPHGPFFDRLGRALKERGHTCWRIGFNRGDERFWRDRASYIPFPGTTGDWPGFLDAMVTDHGITDIVLYGDTRPVHAEARSLAAGRGLIVHVFEEGYLRPFWVTYERGGSNGNSALMGLTLAQMRAALPPPGPRDDGAPAHWGDMRQHMFYGALYHFHVLLRNAAYRNFKPHRHLTVAQEFRLYLWRYLLLPVHRLERFLAETRIRLGHFPYYTVLMQLEHDASFRDHSDFVTTGEFIDLLMAGFAEGAAPNAHLVFKAHPLEDGRVAIKAAIRQAARANGVAGRVHFVRGGKLAHLLDRARAAVTVNSTAAQQALWRGLPVRAFGRAVYGKPEFTSGQPPAEFFAAPHPPDIAAYRDFRRFLLATSQIPGGYYSQRGRNLLLDRLPELMSRRGGPYETTPPAPSAAQMQHS